MFLGDRSRVRTGVPWTVTVAVAVVQMLCGSDACENQGVGFGCTVVDLAPTGTIRGNVWQHGEEFLMIPYAHATRFNPPTMRETLPESPFDATNIGGLGQAACLQGPYLQNESSYGTENCLILNLYRPRNASANARLPILLWVFGGDNTASEIIPYNATRLAGNHAAIVAVVSYRLGLFGFSAFADEANATTGGGNNGLLDVLAAAAWLKKFGPQFGGDPTRMIVFGESSGATDAQILTMSPAARGVFRGSISESGGLYANTLEGAINSTLAVATAVGCHGRVEPIRSCMEKKAGSDLIASASDSFWGPTVDGVILPDDPRKLLKQGKLNPGVSVLWGANTNDSSSPYMFNTFVSEHSFIEQLNETIHGEGGPGGTLNGARGGGIRRSRRHHARAMARSAQSQPLHAAVASDLLAQGLEVYPPRKFGDHHHPLGNNADLVGWFESDQFMCSAKRDILAASKAVSDGGKAFLYRFDWFFQSTTTCVADSNYHIPKSGSNHADDLTFVFGQPIFDNQDAPGYSYTNCSDPASAYYDKDRCVGCEFNQSEATFSFDVGSFWSEFARSGAPATDWTPFTATTPANMVLHPGAIGLETNLSRSAACEFWDAVDRATAHGGPPVVLN